ncbi:hypothetical protein EV356DRAFT_534928 [Viridothelium virens]|uniref:Uncharacterized protein n=1 Tax=Viridothelium virens TaxID=1048519 RepID=A0A6A6H231_VIRVR|nr:hypothetical protein EV356DRAFT_534928 [Viridothelium virens]
MDGVTCFAPEPDSFLDPIPDMWPCGPLNSSNPSVACCNTGDLCYSDQICRKASLDPDGPVWYVGGCTDEDFHGCYNRCVSSSSTLIAYNEISSLWACCGSNGCNSPSNETFPGPEPWKLLPIATLPPSSVPSSDWPVWEFYSLPSSLSSHGPSSPTIPSISTVFTQSSIVGSVSSTQPTSTFTAYSASSSSSQATKSSTSRSSAHIGAIAAASIIGGLLFFAAIVGSVILLRRRNVRRAAGGRPTAELAGSFDRHEHTTSAQHDTEQSRAPLEMSDTSRPWSELEGTQIGHLSGSATTQRGVSMQSIPPQELEATDPRASVVMVSPTSIHDLNSMCEEGSDK